MARTRHFENLFSITEIEIITRLFGAPVQFAKKPNKANMNKPKTRYRLTWTSEDGKTGQGEVTTRNLDNITKLAELLNLDRPHRKYVVEPVKPTKNKSELEIKK